MTKGQTHKHSAAESVANVAIGLLVSILGQLIIFPLLGINVPFTTNLQVAFWFTVLSLTRTYLLRRYFNRMMIAMHLREKAE